MIDGTGPYWGWFRSEINDEPWRAWKGTNTGFDQSPMSIYDTDTPMVIPTSDGVQPIVALAPIFFPAGRR